MTYSKGNGQSSKLKTELDLLIEEIKQLLGKNAIERVHPQQVNLLPVQFFPHHKEIGRMETHPQPAISQRAHKAPSIQDGIPRAAVLPELKKGWWGATLDLKDAYLHIAIDPSDKKWLGFCIDGQTYRFKSLPFGLSTAPRTFTQIVKVVAEHLRRKGVYVFVYLDDWLLTAPSVGVLRRNILITKRLVHSLGFIINEEKSAPEPTQRTQFLGALLDFKTGRAFSTQERVQAITECAKLITREQAPAARHWMCLLGLIASLTAILPLCRLRMRIIQLHVLSQVQKPQAPIIPQDSSDKQGQEGRIMVDTASQHSTRQAVFSAPYIIYLNHGCIQDRMGSPLEEHPSLGHLVPVIGQAPHQYSGAVGHPHRSAAPSQASQRPVRLGEMRQHVGGDVSQQDGRSAEPSPVPADGPSPALVQSSPDLHSSSPPSGSRQHLGGQTVEERDSHQGPNKDPWLVSGLAPEQDSVPLPVQQSGTTPDRPLCGQHEQSTANLLQLGEGPEGLRTRCDVDQLEHGTSVYLPSDRSHPSGPGETLQVQELPLDSHSPQMAPPDVVHKTSDNGSRRSNSPSPLEGSHPDSRGNSPTTSDSQDSEPDSMTTFVRSYTQVGLSKEAAAIAGEARRSSTRRTYNTRIQKYYRWCKQHKVAPHSVSVGEVCEFLTWVFTQEEASPNSVRACKTAVGAVHQRELSYHVRLSRLWTWQHDNFRQIIHTGGTFKGGCSYRWRGKAIFNQTYLQYPYPKVLQMV